MDKIANVIGEGAYGCVHKPSLTCKSKRISYKNKISKIMLYENARKELDEYMIISATDPTHDYYTGDPTICKVNETAKNKKSIEKCKNIKLEDESEAEAKDSNITYKNEDNDAVPIDDLSLLIMEDGGLDLKKYGNMVKKQKSTAKHIKKNMLFWIEVHRLFRGLVVFQHNGLMHHDLKMENIVYNEKKNRINYIDFGFMTEMEKEIKISRQSENRYANSPFWSFPFEVKYMNRSKYMRFAKKTNTLKNEYFIQLMEKLKKGESNDTADSMRIFFGYILQNQTDNDKRENIKMFLNDFYTTLMDEIKPDKYDDFLHKTVKTFDIFGLAFGLIPFLENSRHFMDKKTYQEFYDCFYHMITPNIIQRYTIEEAMDNYENCLSNSGFLKKCDYMIENHILQKGKTNKIEKMTDKIEYSNILLSNQEKKNIIQKQLSANSMLDNNISKNKTSKHSKIKLIAKNKTHRKK